MIQEKRRYVQSEIEIKVRFSEVDAMRVVWHGNYLKYFEDAREALGLEQKLNYLDIAARGFFVPIVHSEIDHLWPITYGSKAKVVARLIDTRAAKIIHEYEVWDLDENKLSARGKTIQVFITMERKLELNIPDFFEQWKAGLKWIED
jgi:acyl-CoA thioester hydrolase